ncbi:Arsenate-mycothiol transferase ArsC2 [Thalassoglobus neptunius]|uniref:Arsenate-mycothiol transferase ArsC2 n=1 Tax=Thalassoglobus neptunius TaxID=1938619 RepID=A0A5C5XA52_9PLAN|nr:arsenate reductase ArsC [Thalassoglobus neptunius]TWT58742.1 Arsenate-mycothiol transferase ArsC2 [Thalassoglobus neptunius]
MQRVLILCTGNSCRSQMAEALWESHSAGSKPSGYVHPLAVEAMSELGIDISSYESKSVGQFENQAFDLVVTVCDNARESCPVFPGAKSVLHWPFEDPADATGTEAQKLEVFRRIRDEIKQKISEYLSSVSQGV